MNRKDSLDGLDVFDVMSPGASSRPAADHSAVAAIDSDSWSLYWS